MGTWGGSKPVGYSYFERYFFGVRGLKKYIILTIIQIIQIIDYKLFVNRCLFICVDVLFWGALRCGLLAALGLCWERLVISKWLGSSSFRV